MNHCILLADQIQGLASFHPIRRSPPSNSVATILERSKSTWTRLLHFNIASYCRKQEMLQARALEPDFSPGCQVLEQSHGGPSSSRPRSTHTRLITPTTDVEGSQEELVWSESSVVWSRGCQVYRQMSFDQDGEQVLYALFAPFQLAEDTATSTPDRKGKEKEKDSRTEMFGPFHISHQEQWGQPKALKSSSSSRLERCLMIILETRAYIFFPSGSEAVVHVPFKADKAWPLATGGVIIQRQLHRRSPGHAGRGDEGGLLQNMDTEIGNRSILDTLTDLDDEDGEGAGRLWTLERPFEELKVLCDGSTGESSLPTSSNVLLVAEEPCPLVVIHDTDQNRIDFYSREKTRTTIADPAISPSILPRKSPEEVGRPPDTTTRKARPSLARNVSGFGQSTSNDRRLSGMADPLERASRRAPRLSRGSGPDKEPAATTAEGELHATLDPPPFTMTVSKPPAKGRARTGSHSSSVADRSDRRKSSAFLSGPGVPATETRGLSAIAEKDLRETTMLQGLEKRVEIAKSDIRLVRFASWQCPPWVMLSWTLADRSERCQTVKYTLSRRNNSGQPA